MTLAWATTIHKVQGLTLVKIVVDMKGGWQFSPGQKVKTLESLHILNFDASVIKQSDRVHEKMSRLNTQLLHSCNVGHSVLHHDYITYRRDRQSDNSKGGVMISLEHQFQTSDIVTFTFTMLCEGY